MTSSNGNIFRVTVPLWGEPSVTGGSPSQRPVTRSFHVFFDFHLNKRLSKQSTRRWFENPSRSLWRHCNGNVMSEYLICTVDLDDDLSFSILSRYMYKLFDKTYIYVAELNIGYSISQEICTRFLLCCALLWLYIDWFPISIRLTSLALWQSNDCHSASKATLMNMDKYFMWIHYGRLHNHNKAKHNKTVCIFLRICCTSKPRFITSIMIMNACCQELGLRPIYWIV